MRVQESGTSPGGAHAQRTSNTDTHRVERGDTLSELAARYGTTVQAFMRANPQIRDADLIFTGDRLNIPGASGGGSSAGGGAGPNGGAGAGGTSSSSGGKAGWMTIARNELGQREIAGAADNARIVQYHDTTTLSANDDETPWCASFVNWTVEKAGFKGTDSAAAISWASWGDKVGGVGQAREGDVVVLRNKSSGQEHVAFFVKGGSGSVTLLGGNQSNQVKESTYSLSNYNVVAVRRPPGTSGGDASASAAAPSAGTPSAAKPGGALDINRIENVRGNPNVTPSFLAKVDAMAQRLGTKPEYLLAVMSFESGLRPDAVNKVSDATGLIQFIPPTARALGTSTAALKDMSAEQQLKFVEAYFKPFKGKLNTLEGVYTAVLSGSARPDPNTTLFSRGTLAYSQNSGLDFNGNGRITSGEATSAVASRLFGVTAVQQRLVDVGAASGAGFADGQFGPKTSAAIGRFQQDKGLPQTGLLDEATGRALFAGSSTAPKPSSSPPSGGGVVNGQAWPVPGHRTINHADKPGEGEGEFGTSRGGGTRTHKGIDIVAPVGSSVVAFRAGTVTDVAQDPGGYGLWISVRHADGLSTRYAHLSDADVKVGDKVRAGQEIGNVGRSGNTPSTGDAHLHFETRLNAAAVDPQKYL